MGKGLPRSQLRGVPLTKDIIKQTLSLNALSITVDGATGIGFGGAVAGDFPEGNILFLGAVANLTFTTAAANIIATWAGSFGVGTTPNADTSLATTEVNLIGATTLTAATAGVSPTTRGTGNTAAIFDNTDGSLEINLNLLVDDASISANGQVVTCTGTIQLAYVMLLDD